MSKPASGDCVTLGSGSLRTGGFLAGVTGVTGVFGAFGAVVRFAIALSL
jgi:hypothetical protein